MSARAWGYRLLGRGFDYLLHLRPAEWPIMAVHLLTGSALAGMVLPSDDGYTTAFLVSAAIATVLAVLAAGFAGADSIGGGGPDHELDRRSPASARSYQQGARAPARDRRARRCWPSSVLASRSHNLVANRAHPSTTSFH